MGKYTCSSKTPTPLDIACKAAMELTSTELFLREEVASILRSISVSAKYKRDCIWNFLSALVVMLQFVNCNGNK